MSLDVEQRLRVYLSSAPPAVRNIQTVELLHSALSQPWLLWAEPYEGTITTEDDEVRTVTPANLLIDLAGEEGNLDQAYTITLDTVPAEDGQDTFRVEMDAIPVQTQERVTCIYREYLSDDLTAIVGGPLQLQVESVSYKVGIAALSAVSPRLNVTRTGSVFAVRDIPMLRGFL